MSSGKEIEIPVKELEGEITLFYFRHSRQFSSF